MGFKREVQQRLCQAIEPLQQRKFCGIPVLAGLPVILLAAGLFTGVVSRDNVPLAPPPAAIQANPVPVPGSTGPAAQKTVTVPHEELELEVTRGDTLETLFRAYSLSLVDLAEIMQLDTARGHLRILRPGDTLQVRHEDGRVLSIDRPIDIGRALRITRTESAFSAEIIELPIEHRLVEASGKIASSLFEAAADARISEPLVMKLAEIFAWDIDFVRDIGSGDEFTLVYEELWRDNRKLGEGRILAAEFINRGSRFTAVRFQPTAAEQADYYSSDGNPMRKAFVRAPLSFTRISSGFNPRRRHPILNTIRAHKGVDYAAPAGTAVKAAGDGKVIFRGWKSGYGNTVILQHPGNVTTLYGHLSRFDSRARYGSRVRQGEVIAFVGATGLATAPHLHYEYRRNGVHLNPRTVKLPEAQPLTGARLAAFQTAARPLLDRLAEHRRVVAANISAR